MIKNKNRKNHSLTIDSRRKTTSKSKLSSGIIKISRTLSINQIERMKRSYSIETSRTKFNDLSTHRKKIGFIFFVISILCFIIIILINQLTANFKLSININETQKNINLNKYQQLINDYANKNPLSHIRSLLDSESLDSYILINSPEILSITDNGKMSIFETDYRIKFRKPVARWEVNGSTYYVDTMGISFENNYFNEPELSVIDNSGIKLDKGHAIASNNFLHFVGKVVAVALSKGYIVTEAIIPTDTTRQLNIKVKGRGTVIKMAVDRDVSNQIEDMNNSIVYLDSKSIQPEYIDIRVSGKAYYK